MSDGPGRPLGSSGIQPFQSLAMSHSAILQQGHLHHSLHRQLAESQISHQYQQQSQRQSHPQSADSLPLREPLSPHPHQVSISPLSHSQGSMSPHPPHQHSPQLQHSPAHQLQHSPAHQLQHSSVSTSLNVGLDRPHSHPAPQQPLPSPSSSVQHQSQGVNTSESAADIASSSLRSHLCDTCHKGFRSKQQLIQHSLVHTNVRKYTCTFCDRAFKQLSHLQQHVRIHTGEKPYACKYEDCDRAFAQMANLQHHMRNHEEQIKKEALRVYKCQICHRSYTNEGSLKTHRLKMHLHLEDSADSTEEPAMKFFKTEKGLSGAPTMVPPGQPHNTAIKGDTVSSDDELNFLGSQKDPNGPSAFGNISNISMTTQSGTQLTATSSTESRNTDSDRSSANLGLPGMGLRLRDPGFISPRASEAIEQAAAAAAAAVTSQLAGSGHTPLPNSSLSSYQPLPQPAHSQLTDSHIRSQVSPGTLLSLHDQFYGHGGSPAGMLSSQSRFMSPAHSSALTYSSQISSASSMVTTSAVSGLSGLHRRPPSTLASPHHIPESLNFNH